MHFCLFMLDHSTITCLYLKQTLGTTIYLQKQSF
uniref:Uncharacterized protein n=1 Tax=Arundo donax TaxID=35708 RepID=A0A0A8YFE2_ARUDO